MKIAMPGFLTNRRMPSAASPLLCLVAACVASAAAEPAVLPGVVEVARAPDRPWVRMDTRTLGDLPVIPPDPEGGRYGGTPVKFGRPTGFFRVVNPGGRWWLVDPDGHLFVHRGVTSIRQTRTAAARKSLSETFGTPEKWAASTEVMLKEAGFNGLGAWCDEFLGHSPSPGLVYTRLWNFMSAYGKRRGGTYQKSGHVGYPDNCPFIFDPGFAEFCDEHARQLAATKDDPWLLGHFTDNELPWRLEMLESYLGLPEGDPGRAAASAWLRKRRGPEADESGITGKDRADFVAFAADTYFSTVAAAIRRHDPNHLVLGSRFHGRGLRIPGLFEAAGRHVDVISVNYYHAWTPDADRLAGWTKSSGRPVLVTEWYAKAMDSGLKNTSGAGWLVKTQTDRAAFYQNFTLGLLESPACVGWHWFRYSDNDSGDKRADPSNRDANKGIVTSHYEPYQTLLNAMKEINIRTLGIVRHFDGPKRQAKAGGKPAAPSSR